MPINKQDLIKNPETAPFSRIKYLRSLEDEQVAEFMNTLFTTTIEARETGQWQQVEELLGHWEERLVARFRMPYVFDTAPWTPLAKPLSQCRVALVTTGGIYIEGQEPFNTDGDHSYRSLPRDTPVAYLRVAHTRYDTSGVLQDVNCVFPIERFKELEQEGIIGELAQTNYGFMGYIPKPEGLIEETAPELGKKLRQAKVDAAFITTT